MTDAPPVYRSLGRGPLTERAADQLAELIASGQLAPGDFLPPEAELCKQLGISRPTVREAVRTLETRGLVVRRHGVGVQVVDRTREAATSSIGLMLQRNGGGPRDLLEVRLMLECQAATLAAVRATDDDLRTLSEAIESMRRGSSTVDEYIEGDLNFHLRLAEASKNGVLVSLVHAIRGLLLGTIRATYSVDGRTERRLQDHTRVLDAVARRDAAGAHAAMRDHLRSTEEMLRQLGLLDAAPAPAPGGPA